MNTGDLYALFLEHPSVQTDTRKLRSGDIFFALKGTNFNGNTFARQAIESGASYAVIDEASFAIPGKTILVDDVLAALQDLARFHRRQFSIPFLAITGSNGKTTTKELIHAVLSASLKTYTTEGNLNNQIGIPLTILKIRKDAEIAVIEMGANHQGEIASYCTYVEPTHGLITNCGKAHLEGFGGVEGVRKGKGELYDYLRTHQGTAFVMKDYDYLLEMSRGIPRIITYGSGEADVTGNSIQHEPFLDVAVTKAAWTGTIHTRLVGEYNTPNVLAAVTTGIFFNVPGPQIKNAIEQYQPSNSRSQLIRHGSNQVILDAYNANPSSMRLAIENFAKRQDPAKVLILGGMAELGADSLAEHKAIIELIGQHRWKDVILVGGDFLNIPHPYHNFQNVTEARKWLREQQFENTSWLIKGSRSMQMEKVLEH